MATLRVEGGDKLAATLRTLSTRMSNQVVRQALMEAGESMRSDASRRAPRAPGAPDIADHIVLAPTSSRKAPTVAMGPERWFHYGFYQEFGTSRHRAQPFMRPAFDGNTRGVIQRMTSSAWAILIGRGVVTTRGSGGGGGLA